MEKNFFFLFSKFLLFIEWTSIMDNTRKVWKPLGRKYKHVTKKCDKHQQSDGGNWIISSCQKTIQIYLKRVNPHGVVVIKLDCAIVVSKFKLQLQYCIQFCTNTLRKGMNPFISLSYGLNSTTSVLLQGWRYHEGW